MRRSLFTPKVFLLSLLTASALVVGFLGINKAGADIVRNCDGNAIVKCGAANSSEFIGKVRTDSPGDLHAIYDNFGLAPTDYSKFVSYARMGMAYRNGTIEVDHQVVATNAWSIGRRPKSYSWNYKIGNKTYYASKPQQNFLSDIPVMVMFDKNGVMQFAALTACGNPMNGKKIVPKYSCDLLQKTAVTGKKNTYSFTTKASASNNAKVVKVVYTFGDGTTATETNPAKAVEHTYAKSGTYTAKVTVYVSLPGNQTVTVESANCATQITIAPPFQSCVDLTAFALDAQKRQFRFTVTTNQGNGATLKDASFDFGDNSTADSVSPASENTVVTDHTYAKDGDYTISATVNFSTFEGDKSVNCTTTVHISQEMCAINPSVPANSPECTPCKYNAQLPANSQSCKPPVTPPPSLPNTGAGDVIGLFVGSTLAASIAYRFLLMRRLSSSDL